MINFFKKENTFKKKDFSFNPSFYWKIIVFISTVMIILSFLFGYRLFIQVSQEPALPSVKGDKTADALNKDRISKALDYFSEKEKKSNKILSSPSPVVDPSL